MSYTHFVLSRTYSAIMMGLNPIKIEVEVDSHRGIPNLLIIGLPTKTVDEAKERITSALQHCGIRIKSKRTIVNLAPADVPKRCSHLELAITIGLLKMYGEIQYTTDDTFFCGELSLDGELKPVKGALPLVLAAKEMGFTNVIIPQGNAEEVSIIKDIAIHPLKSLKEYLAFTQDGTPLPTPKTTHFPKTTPTVSDVTFADVQGQQFAKRALTIAAAGGHNAMMIGPPGSGKSILAKAMISLLPLLTEEEIIELTNIYSLSGLHNYQLMTQRPFRAPHHRISDVRLLGGGAHLRPGEITLAHRGILFMDEFLEFNRSAIEALRLPLENRSIQLSRAQGEVIYPAAFSLIAAANPCRCGYFGSAKKACICSAKDLDSYKQKLSGPIIDRIDLHITIKEPDNIRYAYQAAPEELTRIVDQIRNARAIQKNRYQGRFLVNNDVPFTVIKDVVELSSQCEQFLHKAANQLQLTARSYFKIIKVAQTIADVEQDKIIGVPHIAEALQYRFEQL